MSGITYNWGSDYLLIDLGNRTNSRIKVLFWAEFLLVVGMATIFLLQVTSFTGLFNLLVSISGTLLFSFAAYRFFSRMFVSEKLLIDKDSLLIIIDTPFSKKIKSYNWPKIGPLHYVGKPPKTDHPLKGKCFDYLGFDTQEHLIQSLHQEGNMYFKYEGVHVPFAKCVYSWDAEEMIHMMKIFSGPKLKLGPEWQAMLVQE
jgi:hypothetical protein